MEQLVINEKGQLVLSIADEAVQIIITGTYDVEWALFLTGNVKLNLN